MSCISSEDIQIYIDGEATPTQSAMVKKHLLSCEKCAEKIILQQSLSAGVKKAIHLLTEDTVLIPLMAKPSRPIKRKYATSRRLIYIFSAACLLFLVYLNIHKPVSESQNKTIIVSGTEWEVDANRPLSQQELILNVVDAEGNVTEYLIN